MLISKRAFSKGIFGTLVMAFATNSFIQKTFAKNLIKTGENKMPHTLPELPYAQDALEPHISANTLSFHHGKHHNTYVTNLNKLIEGTDLADKDLVEIIHETAKDESKKGIFNNAAQVWNHTFYWNSMKPGGGGEPSGALADKINEDFGSFDAFKEQFAQAGATQFGSGWAWLVCNTDNGKLEIVKTANADMPHPKLPLLTMDVWEHAYYLDFQNKRPDYINTFLESLVNWDFAAENWEKNNNCEAA